MEDIVQIIQYALQEDLNTRGDITTQATIPEIATSIAQIVAKADGVIAGLNVAKMVFQQVSQTKIPPNYFMDFLNDIMKKKEEEKLTKEKKYVG